MAHISRNPLLEECGLPERLAISYQKFGRTRKNWRIRSASRFTRLSRGKADTCEIPPFLLLVWLYRPIYPCGQTFGRLRPNFRVIRNHALALFSFQPCAILWWQKIVLLQKRVSRNRRHFMVRKWRISSLLKRDK